MTSRERILTALAHREPDRVAIDLGSTEASGIALHAYCRLKETLGLQGKARLFNVKQMLADVESEVLSVLGGDVVPLRGRTSAFGTDICHWKKWVSPWGDNCLVPKNFDPILMPDGSYELHSGGEAVGRMPKDGFYFNVNYRYPLSEARTYKDVECICIRRESALDDENVNDFGKRARELFEKTDKAIIYRGEGALFDKLRSFWTYEKAMVLLYEDPNLIEYFLDILAENAVQSYSQLLPAIKDFVQVIVIADDLGTQTGLPISPEMYRRFIIPRQRKIFKYIKEHSDCYVMLHSDGGFFEIIPDLIEAGINILNPVQFTAAGMDPGRLKKEFGKVISFWGGGCDTQETLPFGSSEDVRKQVKEMISIFAPGGGYIFSAVHNILADVTPQNIITMYKTAKKYGQYPIKI